MKVLRKQRRDASLRRQSRNLRPLTCFSRDPFHRLPFPILSPLRESKLFPWSANVFAFTMKYHSTENIERTSHNFYCASQTVWLDVLVCNIKSSVSGALNT